VLYGDFVDPFAPGLGSPVWFGTSDAWLMRYLPGQSPQELAEAEQHEVGDEEGLVEELEAQQGPPQQPEPEQQQQGPSAATVAGPSSVAAALAAGELDALPAALAAEEEAAQATLQALSVLAQEDAAASLLLSTAAQDTPAQPGLLSPPAAPAGLLPQPAAYSQPPLSPAALELTGEWSPRPAGLPPLPVLSLSAAGLPLQLLRP